MTDTRNPQDDRKPRQGQAEGGAKPPKSPQRQGSADGGAKTPKSPARQGATDGGKK